MRRSLLVALTVASCSMVATGTASVTLPEFSPVKGVTYEATTGKNSLETTKSKTTVTCESGTETGEVGEKTISNIKESYKGCASSGVKCSTKGAAAGEIVPATITAQLGYISKSAKTVGLKFAPAAEGAKFVEFGCGVVKVRVAGSLICPITPVNTETTKYEVGCSSKNPLSFEGEKEESVLKASINGGEEQDVILVNIWVLRANKAFILKA